MSKKLFLMVLCGGIILYALAVSASMIATTEDGRTVILHDDKTWDYASTQTKETPKTFAVGDTVKTDSLSFTLKSVRWEASTQEGTRWLIIDGTFQNLSDTPIIVSSDIMLKLYDTEGYEKETTLIAKTKGSLSGTLGPGRKLSGEVAFVVGQEETEWELVFEPDYMIQYVYKIEGQN